MSYHICCDCQSGCSQLVSRYTMKRIQKLKIARGDVHMSSVRNVMLEVSNPHHDPCSVRHCAQIHNCLKLVATDTPNPGIHKQG